MEGEGVKEDDPVTLELCEAYRNAILQKIENVRAEVKSIKNTITVGLSISTAVITIAMLIMNLFGG